MQCNQCHYTLPAGAAYCPNCSQPTPYNAGTVAASAPVPPPPSPLVPTERASGPQAPLAPTQMASGPQLPVAPTQMASGPQQPLAPTQMASPGGVSGEAWQAPPPPPPPPAQNRLISMGQSGPGWEFRSPQSGASWPPAAPPASMPMPAPTPVFVPVAQPKKSGCSTATIIVLVVLLIVVCGGALLATGAWYTQKHNADATVTAMNGDATATADNATATADTAQLTPTPYPPYTESNPPSGQDFSGTAQEIITRAQMASEMNSQDQPTELQSTFEPFQTIYLAYHWANIGYSGYVYTVWYFNGQQESTGTSDYINTDYRYYDGYISTDFSNDGQGAVEVYYCQKSDCSDRQLAWMRPFSVAG